MLRSLVLGMIFLVASGPGMAQTTGAVGLRPGSSLLRVPVTSSLLNADSRAELTDTTSPPVVRPTYWREGALIGGTIAGLCLTAFALAGCSDGDSGASGPCWDNVLLTVGFGFGSGGTLGALLGGLIQKPERALTATPTSR